MIKLKYPCKECTDRYLGCHADCKDYLMVKQEAEQIRKKKKEELIGDVNYMDRENKRHRLKYSRK